MTSSDVNDKSMANKPLPELNDTAHVDDHNWPLRRALKISGIALAIIGIVSLAIWGALRDMPGIWGVVIGVAIAGGFMLMTVVVTLMTSRSTPATTMAVVLGSWLAKIAVVLVVMLLIKDMTFYDRAALATTMIVSLVVLLAAETWSVTKAQQVYI
ncbi:hypothetical protein [Corynebacterium anserum]|uniref:hypothetical protein n=1 Tax=Corynebacterium anserum TaxID=2684406 RepID=UPI0028BEC473|nr:hypothetical protein [Corynebacterium anserum]